MKLMTTIAAAILFQLALPFGATAQSAKAYEKAADQAFESKDYYAASVHLREAMKSEPDEVRLWFKYAEVLRQFNAYEEAEVYYTKVYRSAESARFHLAAFWLGQVKKCLGNYREALDLFEDFSQKNTNDDYYTQWARRELETCLWAMDNPSPPDRRVTIEHLDKKINSPYSEFGAMQQEDLLYFSSYRFDFPGDYHEPERKLAKVMTSEKAAKAKVMAKGFNGDDHLTAHTAFSLGGQRIYFTQCHFITSSDIRCEIFYREKDKKGRWQAKATRLPDAINQKDFTATQPSLAFDSASQKEMLYFVSDRPGGKGKLDIWFSAMEKGQFGAPKNLDAVNTPENDITPFFQQSEKRLYFSSDGHAGLGGYDVFSYRPFDGKVENASIPVNSGYHDIYFSIDDAGEKGYLSSNRPGSFYLDASNKACCYDIFKVSIEKLPPNLPPPPPIVVIPPPTLPQIPTRLEDFLPLALYFDNDEPDKRTTKTITKKTYETTYDRYFPRKPDYVNQFTRPLSEEDAGDAALEIEDFFENEVRKGHDHLFLFGDLLLKRLESGERVEIVIKGYTSPRAESDYNDRLAQRRISSLRNHFEKGRNGIYQKYLATGKLVISEAPYGETKVAGPVSDKLEDERNSVYSVPAARERRVEIVEVK